MEHMDLRPPCGPTSIIILVLEAGSFVKCGVMMVGCVFCKGYTIFHLKMDVY